MDITTPRQTSMARRTNSYFTETREPEKGHWYNVFRPKREKKKILCDIIESNSRLTVALADQCHVLTILSSKNDDLLKQLQSATSDLTEVTDARNQLKAKHSATKDSLSDLRVKFERTEQTWRDRTSALEEKNRNVSRDNDRLATKIEELGKNLHASQEKLEKLGIDNVHLTEEREELHKKLRVAERTGMEEEFKYKLLEKETQLNSERFEQALRERSEQQRQIVEYKKLLFTTRTEKRDLEHELGCQNEALRFEASVVTRELKKCRAKLSKMQANKEIIMTYYQDRLLTHEQWTGCTFQEQITTDSIDFWEDKPRPMLHSDCQHIEYLQNKVLMLEGQVYNQSKLIEELVEMVTVHEPGFRLHDHPHLKVYLDNMQDVADKVYTTDGPNQEEQGLFEDDSDKQILSYNSPIPAFDLSYQVNVCGSDSTMGTQSSESNSNMTGLDTETSVTDVTSDMSFGSDLFSIMSS